MATAANQPSPIAHPHTGAQFVLTQWSVVLAARDAGHAGQRAALERLALAYLPPIYGYLRCAMNLSSADAKDRAHEFLAAVLASVETTFAPLNPANGRFRDFLKRSVRIFALKNSARLSIRKSLHPGRASSGVSRWRRLGQVATLRRQRVSRKTLASSLAPVNGPMAVRGRGEMAPRNPADSRPR